jgi:hypothetical protein
VLARREEEWVGRSDQETLFRLLRAIGGKGSALAHSQTINLTFSSKVRRGFRAKHRRP